MEDFDISKEELRKIERKAYKIIMTNPEYRYEIDNETQDYMCMGFDHALADYMAESYIFIKVRDNLIKKRLEEKKKLRLYEENKLRIRIYDKYLKYKTKSGHRVRSKAEVLIANFLFDNDIKFQYEPYLSLDDEVFPDFYLPKLDVYIEHFGREDEDYKKIIKWKKKQYEKHEKRVIFTYPEDEKDIERVLRTKLQKYK